MRFRPSLIFDVGLRIVFHTILLFSLFLLFAGHNDPGGGFVGGLVAGAAFMLHYVGGGADEVRRAEPAAPETLLGAGVVLATGTGVASWFAGGELLESGYLSTEVPLLGEFSVSSVLAFDIGVYLVVVGLVLGVLGSLGRTEPDADHDAGSTPPPGSAP